MRHARARRTAPVAQLRSCRQLGERRDKPACCRGCKSPTGKENSDSILASSLAGDMFPSSLERLLASRHF